MAHAHKPLAQQVIVITGASSGIGLATARMAARHGARVVLFSRNAEALAAIQEEITREGGEATHVVGDVGRREDLQALADRAIERFGGFDTWVNDAGISIFGRLEEVSDEDSDRLFQTNFWGVVYGSLVAVPHLKRRGGALINLGSIASDLAIPLQAMYSASKHAIRGFTDGLRAELDMDGAPVSVTLIKPGSIDTPLPQHARNYTDREPQLPPPVYHPDEVARAILHAAVHPQREIYVGGGGRVMTGFKKVAPRTFERLGSRLAGAQLSQEPPRDPQGALHRPGQDGHARGEYPGYVRRTSTYTRAQLHPLATGAVMAGVGLAAAALMKRRA
ncbi:MULTISPECIES: SDR family oxidoreductase [Methylobacterium]|jgi:NAD(P)-dependent dehydrogenase (short-subunit alcohol dehydrogenase family)|uniref:3-phenylpropionate-dihydrodiol/cinnamic acid-dihydrodiol dehydrogenase n=1 Tax=Methylobacterium isbiliense TaxID=315478 RepID=A0ABQ4SPE6_9HYPH|nr:MULTISPECIES: SDR family oxidoreductase [Methylobacterium]MBY0299780.1 SDR family oxidoreductase [Methylobacterium sp.]MDN3627578.1 SDR family oxidoreductase [Methylobacterium isbiliense]GJE03710.1 3-phenylpropionate-dihydrodiol/cinnamic acid-dihydrodiol dehydrogenase [Methylobacterium isbiliense]